MNNNVNTSFLVSFLFVIIISSSVSAFVNQLAYDDGTAELSEEFHDGFAYKIVGFDMVHGPYSLESIDTFWTDVDGHESTENFRVWVVDFNGSVLYYNKSMSPSEGWNFHETTEEVLLQDDFYIYVNAPTRMGDGDVVVDSDEMDLGVDGDMVFGHSFFVIFNGLMDIANLNRIHVPIFWGNYMIRATVDNNIVPVLNSIDALDLVESRDFFYVELNGSDLNGDVLTPVCAHDNGLVTFSESECVSVSGNVCEIRAKNGNVDHDVYCRFFDGEYYSNALNFSYDDDNKAPWAKLLAGKVAGKNHAYSNNGNVVLTPSFHDAHMDNCDIGGDYVEADINESAIDLGFLTDGEYFFNLTCVDLLGHSKTVSKSIVVDTVAPVIGNFDIFDEIIDEDGFVFIDWNVSDKGSGVKFSVVRNKWVSDINGSKMSAGWGILKKLSYPVTEFTTSQLAKETSYSFKIRACDFAGLCSESNVKTTMTNSEAVLVRIVNIDDGDIFAMDDVEVIVSYADNSSVTCEASIDGNSYVGMSGDGFNFGNASKTFKNLADGRHDVNVSCNDGVGASDGLTSYANVGFYVDTSDPVVGILAGNYRDIPADYAKRVFVNLSYSDLLNEYESGFDYCEIDWDDGHVSVVDELSSLDELFKHWYSLEGNYDVELSCYDVAGNFGSAVDSIIVDKTAPVSAASISGEMGCNNWYTGNALVEIDAIDSSSGVDFTKYRVIGLTKWAKYSTPFEISEEGVWVVEFFSKDNALNKEAIKSIVIKVDKTAPEMEIVSPINSEHLGNKSVDFYGDFTDLVSGFGKIDVEIFSEDGSTLAVGTLNSLTGGIFWNYSYDFEDNLEYFVRTVPVDGACNVGESAEVEFTVVDLSDIFYTKMEVDAQLQELDLLLRNLIAQESNKTEAELEIIRDRIDFIYNELSLKISELEDEDEVLYEKISKLRKRINYLKNVMLFLFDEVFDELENLNEDVDEIRSDLEELDVRISAVVERMNHGTINLMHRNFDSVNELKVWGEAPEDASSAIAYMCDIYGSCEWVDNISFYVVDGKNKYDTLMNLTGMENGRYNVGVKFFDENNNCMEGYDVGGLFYGLDDFGFVDVDVDGVIATYLSSGASGLISYEVVLDETIGQADIRIRSVDGSIDKILRSQTFFAGNRYYLKDNVDFSGLGNYELYLTIDGTDWMSYVVLTEVKDIAPTSEITIVSPGVNNNDVYWFNSLNVNEITLETIVLASSVEETYSYLIDNAGSSRAFMDEYERSGKYFAGIVLGSLMFDEERIYNLTVDAMLGHGSASVEVGVDNTAPIVSSIVPGAGAYAGVMMVYSNVSDEASGVRSVWIDLTAKNNASIVFKLPGVYNNLNGLYEAGFDSVEMGIPNGNYNITVTAADYAGNVVSAMVDPIIDNDAPDISGVFVSEIVYNDTYLMKFGARVVDAPAGVDYVYALLSGDNGSVNERFELVYDGYNYIGSYSNESLVGGNYSVVIFAVDLAGNEANLSYAQNVSVVSRPVVVKTVSSGGSGGGSGGSILKSCSVGNWDCSEWAVCSGGLQARTCEKTVPCAEIKPDAIIPGLSRSCVVPEVEVVEEKPEEVVEEGGVGAVEDEFLSMITGAVVGGSAKGLGAVVGLIALVLGGFWLIWFKVRK